ncbi:MAG: hypothetical protein Q8R69_26560, partial [Telluria sp.]|nr:hypothetical protein [Telluria sp.]MDP3673244.1 hypothetical protein [Telluria sp.]
MTEATRPLPHPELNKDGSWKSEIAFTPASMTTRGSITLPTRNAIPVIVVPGIMGTNLRATTDPSQEQNRELKPGEAAWRPPNGV